MSRPGPKTMIEPPVEMSSNAMRAAELRRRDAVPGRAADLDRLGPAAAHLLQQLGDGDAERELVDARLVAVAGDAEQLEAGGLRVPIDLNHSAPFGQDAATAGERLDVVDDGRLADEPGVHRERRPVARLAAVAFERFDERRLLAADVGAGAHPDLDVEIEAGRRRTMSCPAGRSWRRRSSTSSRCGPQVGVLAAQVEDARRRADGAGRDRHALEHEVGVVGQEHPVLERARLALVGVAHDVLLPPALILAAAARFHLMPVGNPAPPRPRRFDAR